MCTTYKSNVVAIWATIRHRIKTSTFTPDLDPWGAESSHAWWGLGLGHVVYNNDYMLRFGDAIRLIARCIFRVGGVVWCFRSLFLIKSLPAFCSHDRPRLFSSRLRTNFGVGSVARCSPRCYRRGDGRTPLFMSTLLYILQIIISRTHRTAAIVLIRCHLSIH